MLSTAPAVAAVVTLTNMKLCFGLSKSVLWICLNMSMIVLPQLKIQEVYDTKLNTYNRSNRTLKTASKCLQNVFYLLA